MILNEGILYSTPIPADSYLQIFFAAIILVILSSYLLGSINTAIVVSKLLYKDDIRNHGSGNAGLTNMLRTYGKGAAALTLLGDMLKTVFAILISGLLFGLHYQSGISLQDYGYVAALFAVLGHIFPIYYKFKGGKGVLATATAALILTPVPFLILIALFIVIVAMSKYVSLGSVSVAVLYPVLVNGYFSFAFGATPPGILSLCTIILAILIVWCHRENLKRISDKTERKISFKKKDVEVKKEENEADE